MPRTIPADPLFHLLGSDRFPFLIDVRREAAAREPPWPRRDPQLAGAERGE